jgi:hypothetical protein
MVLLAKPKQTKKLHSVDEVSNKLRGRHQYFSNRYGQFAEETVTALLEIGATKKSELLKKAHQLVNSDHVSPDQFRKRLFARDIPSLFENDDLAAPLDELADEYENRNEEDIHELLGSYLQKHSR